MTFPCFYNAPLSYYAALLADEDAPVIEIYDNYTRQTYRNRCRIIGGNGPIDLIVPVIKEHGKKTLMKDVKIDHEMPWPLNHWKSIQSSYASSPFFEYLEDIFEPIYRKHFTYLLDLNLELIKETLSALNLAIKFDLSEKYMHHSPGHDLSMAIHPKKDFKHEKLFFHPDSYYQVFSERFGFIEDPSILDLLFNEGPAAQTILHNALSLK